MSEQIDVLAVQYLLELAGDYRRGHSYETAEDIEAQADAVAELIEADKAYDSAREALRCETIRDDERGPHWQAYKAAIDRRSAALARCGGAK